MHKYIIISLLGICTASASAQFNQSISVEGKYVPEIFRLDRINSFPKQVKFSLDANPLAYDGKSVPASFAPMLLAMPATGWADTRDFSHSRGYLEIGAGSWLNSTLSAGYRFIDDKGSTLGFRLQHNSTSLWKPNVSELMKDTKQYRYDESLGIYGSHDFSGKGKLTGAIDYHIGNFNYYGFDPQWGIFNADNAPLAPTQTLNDISARFLWQSPAEGEKISWSAGAGVRYFGYRSIYCPLNYEFGAIEPDAWALGRGRGGRETDLNLNGGFSMPLSSGSTFGVDVNADVLFYADDNDMVGRFNVLQPDNYGVVTLTPYYRFSRDRLLVRVGADIDLAFNAGEEFDGSKSHKYGFLHVAPDIKVDYLAGPVAFYLHALGGTRLNTLAYNYDQDYYQTPSVGSSCPVYSPLDGSLGATFGPFSGFSAGVDFAFRVTRGEYLGGWYQTALNYAGNALPGLPRTAFIDNIERELSYDYSNSDFYNLHGISLGARASYDAGKILKVEAKGNYQPQKGSTGYFNGYDRPRWTALISAETNPWKTLKFKLAYEYRGVRNIYTMADYVGSLISDSEMLVGYRLPDITYLNFGASYGISRNFNIWLQADNLLNRHDELLPCLPQQGIRIAGGFAVTF
ncbi:MAG: hypothetical protein K2K97_12650 [Muribaculaceae bacterium]|nr:hypothetical protein [Muribaculaceae bacterium]